MLISRYRVAGVLIVALLAGLALVGCPKPPATTVSVPDVVGQTQAAAEAAITGAGLAVGTVTEANSDTVAAGLVISQDPAAGTSVASGASVALVVSKGAAGETRTVPDVVGLTQSSAQVTITSAGLTVGTVTEAYSDTVVEGRVISQDPASGTSVSSGSSVDLVMSKGPSPILVPDVVGMTQAAAEAAIDGVGLTVGTVTQSSSATVLAGNVISQDPTAGSEASAGNSVDLTISTGPEMVEVPDVVRETQADAEEDLTKAGFTVGTVTPVCSDVIAEGYVISQDPVAEVEQAEGSAVDLVVSSGLCTVAEVPIAMIDVLGGTFTMGDGTGGRPIHSVTLSPYTIGKFEVTNMEYAAMLNWALGKGYLENSSGGLYTGGDPRVNGKIITDINTSVSDTSVNRVVYEDGAFSVDVTYGFSRELHPMTCVTWYGCVAFCNWLSELQELTPAYDLESWVLVDMESGDDAIQFSNGYRLPTEAEWEYAAAWDGTTRWDYGTRSNTMDTSRATYARSNPLGIKGYPYTTIVGYYDGVNAGTVSSPSGAGCYDMSGNVAEWVYDWVSDYPDHAVTNPTGPDEICSYRVCRGGYWNSGTERLLADDREGRYGSVEGSDIGFRVARSPSK